MDLLTIISFLCILGALGLLTALCIVDLKHRILPNKLVLSFLCLGFIFHLSTRFEYLPITDMALGSLIGAGSLYLIRFAANWHYKTDTLGLGDVKLMGAAGIWLGPYLILIALTAGAIAGILHGLGCAVMVFTRTKHWPNLASFSLPAGPGFAVGIVIAALIMLQGLPKVLFG